MAIAIMCSGGDSAGMNPAIKTFVDRALVLGEIPYLIYDGLEGIIDNQIKLATHEDVGGIVHKGGTILRSSRSKRFFEYAYREKAYQNLQDLEIDKVVVLGGDGSFRAFGQFYKDFGINFIGIPATIDNDIFGTDYCLGVDTALNVIRVAIDQIRDTASSFRRAFVVETMGRDCGYLALVSSVTSGAEVCIIPELSYDLESLGKRLQAEISEGRIYTLCIVSEGAKATNEIAKWIQDDVGMQARVTILGHTQRGGNPTVYDRLMAFKFARMAVDKLLASDQVHDVVVHKDSEFDFVSIEYINSGKYEIDPELLQLADRMVR
ncbi:MAG: 6-phosphofructokinase [Epsilonproteobacteria bacterium]|nr:6-phosphofructokinase [Campylobacterota bacterium]